MELHNFGDVILRFDPATGKTWELEPYKNKWIEIKEPNAPDDVDEEEQGEGDATDDTSALRLMDGSSIPVREYTSVYHWPESEAARRAIQRGCETIRLEVWAEFRALAAKETCRGTVPSGDPVPGVEEEIAEDAPPYCGTRERCIVGIYDGWMSAPGEYEGSSILSVGDTINDGHLRHAMEVMSRPDPLDGRMPDRPGTVRFIGERNAAEAEDKSAEPDYRSDAAWE